MEIGRVTEHHADVDGGHFFYLASGPEDGPLVIFVHGWPELSISWRHQLPHLGSLGFRAIALDMPGYGRSVRFDSHEGYATENIVRMLISFLDGLGAEKAVWVGHDMGSPITWSVASHHPERCLAVASLGLPYMAHERGIDHLLTVINRDIYPEDEHPAGQWDYMYFYRDNFPDAQRAFEANPGALVKAMMTKGDPEGGKTPLVTAGVRARGGWFEGDEGAPDGPLDPDLLTVEDLHGYVSSMSRNGFFGPNSYYMNFEANAEYYARSVNGHYLDMPVLFVLSEYDYWCESIVSPLADDMRRYVRDLTSVSITSGHWVQQERPTEVNSALVNWLATSGVWPERKSVQWQRAVD
ncbi:alpha/beta fold hydrolase [Pseudonocardia pini]|uniref:alpha/beta fold hydrolase n=1 Tax=Pseudonocardia pini TaxID=2758030 RepID=UPI0015F051A9|nr:alpha/beta hydrolase [Pseudonocardia pini]